MICFYFPEYLNVRYLGDQCMRWVKKVTTHFKFPTKAERKHKKYRRSIMQQFFFHEINFFNNYYKMPEFLKGAATPKKDPKMIK